MIRKGVIFLLIITLLEGCYNKKKDKIYLRLTALCNQLYLNNCYIDFKHFSDSNYGQRNELSINIEETLNTNSFYRQNSNYLSGKIAYEIYLTIDSIEDTDKYSNITTNILIDGQQFSNEYSISRLKLTEHLINTIAEFLIAAENQNTSDVRNYTSLKYISDSTLTTILQGIKHMSKCGSISSVELLGLYFDKIEDTGEDVTVIEKYFKREQAEEQITFYLSNKDRQIIYINMKSSMDCIE
jgi:hypothetical protein